MLCDVIAMCVLFAICFFSDRICFVCLLVCALCVLCGVHCCELSSLYFVFLFVCCAKHSPPGLDLGCPKGESGGGHQHCCKEVTLRRFDDVNLNKNDNVHSNLQLNKGR